MFHCDHSVENHSRSPSVRLICSSAPSKHSLAPRVLDASKCLTLDGLIVYGGLVPGIWSVLIRKGGLDQLLSSPVAGRYRLIDIALRLENCSPQKNDPP